MKNLKDYTIQGLFFDFPSYNSNAIYILIETVDLTKQRIENGYVVVDEVEVRYKDYMAGIILGRKIADKTVKQTLYTKLTRKVTVDNYDYLFKRQFKLLSPENNGNSLNAVSDFMRVDLV